MTGQPYPRMYLYRRLVQAKLFIDKHYAEAIDLDAISDEAYFSKFHFIKQFKTIYGQTPHQYLIAVRVDRAMGLLNEGHAVSEACYAVGFESVSSFSGLFKRVAGMTPSAYIDRRQKIKAQVAEAPLTFIPGCFAEKRGWLKK